MKVLLGINGSREAEAACEWLTGLQWGWDDSVTLVMVLPNHPHFLSGRVDVAGKPSGASNDSDHLAAEEIVRQALRKLDTIFPTAETRIHAGLPAEEILNIAAEIGADLIVVGCRRKSALTEWFRGSVSDDLLKQARCPVVLVKPGVESVSRVTLAYDGSPESEAALQWVLRLPMTSSVPITVVSIAEATGALIGDCPPLIASEYLATLSALEKENWHRAKGLADHAAERLKDAGYTVEVKVRCGDAASEIHNVAVETGADLVLLGGHAQHGWIKDLLGNTARSVVRHATCSVLIARTPAIRYFAPESDAPVEETLEGADEDIMTELELDFHEGTDEDLTGPVLVPVATDRGRGA